MVMRTTLANSPWPHPDGQRGRRPAPVRLSPLGLLYGIGTWLQFLLLGAAGGADAAAHARRCRAGAPLVSASGAAGAAPGRHAARAARTRSAAAALYRGRATTPAISMAWCCAAVAAALLQLRHQARNVGGTAGRHAAAPHRRRVRRAAAIACAGRATRAGCCATPPRGHALVFFPEGTFSTAVGLLRFHIGAFAAAVRADLPVVPVAIRGTRHCLPPGSLLAAAGHHSNRSPGGAARACRAAPGSDAGDRAALLRDAARARRCWPRWARPDLAP